MQQSQSPLIRHRARTFGLIMWRSFRIPICAGLARIGCENSGVPALPHKIYGSLFIWKWFYARNIDTRYDLSRSFSLNDTFLAAAN